MANQQHSGNAGNFANDRDKASEAGRKGGEHSHSGQHSQSGGDQHSSSTESIPSLARSRKSY
ncbi:MAG: stress-induced protein, partial [Starkeya sp.]|nr:stress-induced protein [Starkeya sp.]